MSQDKIISEQLNSKHWICFDCWLELAWKHPDEAAYHDAEHWSGMLPFLDSESKCPACKKQIGEDAKCITQYLLRKVPRKFAIPHIIIR